MRKNAKKKKEKKKGCDKNGIFRMQNTFLMQINMIKCIHYYVLKKKENVQIRSLFITTLKYMIYRTGCNVLLYILSYYGVFTVLSQFRKKWK